MTVKGKSVRFDEQSKKGDEEKKHDDVSDPSGTPAEEAKEVASSGCDGVVVGSSIVEYIEKNANDKNLTQNVGKLIKSFILELNKQ